MSQVKIGEHANKLLDELAANRKKNGAVIRTKKLIIEELVVRLHKREVG